MTKREMILCIVTSPVYEGIKDEKWLMKKSKQELQDMYWEMEEAETCYDEVE